MPEDDGVIGAKHSFTIMVLGNSNLNPKLFHHRQLPLKEIINGLINMVLGLLTADAVLGAGINHAFE